MENDKNRTKDTDAKKQDSQESDKTAPVSPRPLAKPTNKAEHHIARTWQYLGLVLFCFVAAFFGSWLFLATGIVSQDSLGNITENRTNIVVQEGELVADIAEQVEPSVVSIVTESRASPSFFGGGSQSAGTGIIISEDGYVLTNRHVIPGSSGNVELVASDGTLYEDVSVVGHDPLNDIGFLKINGAEGLQAATLGNSHDVDVGQKVIAIGYALGQYQNTVTSGIISGIGRPVQAANRAGEVEQLDNLFQTDAAINPGNSGGPLLNLDGQVIGVNTAIAEEAEGVGFSIPINAAKGLIKTVTETGEVKRSYLGVQYRSITPALARELDLPVNRGAFISSGGNESAIVSDSPADKAGLQNRDIIIKVDGTDVNERTGLALLLAERTPGEEVTLTVLRDGREIEVRVTLGTYNR